MSVTLCTSSTAYFFDGTFSPAVLAFPVLDVASVMRLYGELPPDLVIVGSLFVDCIVYFLMQKIKGFSCS